MTPAGQRGFPTVAEAKSAAINAKVASFVVISQQHRMGFNQAGTIEFAWVGPVDFFMSRSLAAIAAGIAIVEMGP